MSIPIGSNFNAVAYRMPKTVTNRPMIERLFSVRRLRDKALFECGQPIVCTQEHPDDPDFPNELTLIRFTKDKVTGLEDLGFVAKNKKTGHVLRGLLNNQEIIPKPKVNED